MKETQTTNNQNKEEYMKRIKSLLVSALLAIVSANVSAQADGTFQFIDKDGNTVADGSTCTFNAHYDEDWGMVMAHIDLSAKNTTSEEAFVSAQVVTEKLPNGTFQFCFPNTCPPNVPANYITDTGSMGAGEVKNLLSKWMPDEGKYGTATFTIQLRTMEGKTNTVKAYGPKITVNCVYADPTGIDEVLTDNGDTTINVYDASGKTVIINRPASALMSLGKGLYICETMKDGKRVAVRKIVK